MRRSVITLVAGDDPAANYERAMLATSENSLRWIASWFATCASEAALDKFSDLITDIALGISKAIVRRRGGGK